MVKRTKLTNDPGPPHKRQRLTENVRASTRASTSSIPGKKSGSSNLTPTRSSTRKNRSNANVAAMEDSSDDWTPPPSIISRPSMKRRIQEKGTSRKSSNEKGDVTETEEVIIDFTDPPIWSPKSPRKRPKVDPDSFINLCSDEEMDPQPRKKRNIVPVEDVIFISSGDEAEFPAVQQTSYSLEHAAEAQFLKEGYFTAHSAESTDPVASDGPNGMEAHHDNPDASKPSSTHLHVSPFENDPESVIADIPSSQNMTGIEEIPTPRLSQELLNVLYQESLQKPPAKSLTEESRSASFCNTLILEHKQQFRKIIYTDKLIKPALLTSLFFARAMRSLRTTRPKPVGISQRPNASKAVALIESCVKETNSLGQDDTEPQNFQQNVLDTSTLTISPAPSADTLDTLSMNAAALDKSLDTTTHEDIRVSSPSPLMEVDETETEVVFSTQLSSTPAAPSSCMDESSAKDVPSMETAAEEDPMTVARDTSASREGQATNYFGPTSHAEAGFTEAEPIQNSEEQMMPSGAVDIIFQHCHSSTTLPAVEERTGDILVHSSETSIDSRHENPNSCDEPLTPPTFPDTHLPSREPSHEPVVDSNNNTVDTQPHRDPSHILQTYINPSIFELEHSRNLTFQILFTSDKILDDESDLTISLPYYPERMCY